MDHPGLPIKLVPCSNGEFMPEEEPSEVVQEAQRRALDMVEEGARRHGMDRRDFLLTGMAAGMTLFALSACAREESNGRCGGHYDVSEEAMFDPDAAIETLGRHGPVVDVQTHLLEYPPDYEGPGIGVLFQPLSDYCPAPEGDPKECFTIPHWIEEIFGRSDTRVAIISALSAVGEPNPLSTEIMARARDQVAELCDGPNRVLIQGHAWPNVGPLEAALASMEALKEDEPNIAAWKTYTHIAIGGNPTGLQPPYRLDDNVGEAFLTKVEELGPPIVCVHKGLARFPVPLGNYEYASPCDVGPAAKNHPDLTFCIYHSGFDPDVEGEVEGNRFYRPDDPATTCVENLSVNRLWKTLHDNGIGPGSNVYAELGTTWRLLMGDPDKAGHLLGKLLAAVGEDRILWGTDSIWFGSPQDQIDAFRTFRLSQELQEYYGVEFTELTRQKILWRNAARLHDIRVPRRRLDPQAVEEQRLNSGRRLGNRTYGPRTAKATEAVFDAEHPWLGPLTERARRLGSRAVRL